MKTASKMFLTSPHTSTGRVWIAEELSRIDSLSKIYNVELIIDQVHYIEPSKEKLDLIIKFIEKYIPKVKYITPQSSSRILLDFRRYKIDIFIEDENIDYCNEYDKFIILNFDTSQENILFSLEKIKNIIYNKYPRVIKTKVEWKKQLTPFEYKVCRDKGTEKAFSGEYWNTKDQGIYSCRCCNTSLFNSESKFDSGTGWPSFTKSIDNINIDIKIDKSHGMTRQEVLCSICDCHLGHKFADTKSITGERYCINSISLKLK